MDGRVFHNRHRRNRRSRRRNPIPGIIIGGVMGLLLGHYVLKHYLGIDLLNLPAQGAAIPMQFV